MECVSLTILCWTLLTTNETKIWQDTRLLLHSDPNASVESVPGLLLIQGNRSSWEISCSLQLVLEDPKMFPGPTGNSGSAAKSPPGGGKANVVAMWQLFWKLPFQLYLTRILRNWISKIEKIYFAYFLKLSLCCDCIIWENLWKNQAALLFPCDLSAIWRNTPVFQKQPIRVLVLSVVLMYMLQLW